jgi:hypothetical protein
MHIIYIHRAMAVRRQSQSAGGSRNISRRQDVAEILTQIKFQRRSADFPYPSLVVRAPAGRI